MAQLLSTAPVHIFVVCLDKLLMFLHIRCFVQERKFNVVWFVVLFIEVIKRSRFLFVKTDFTALESLKSNDPRRDSWHTIFGSEWTKRNVFPNLEVSEAPVIQKNESEDVIPSIINLDRTAQRIHLSTNKSTHFNLKVESFAVSKNWKFVIFSFKLTSRPSQRSTWKDNWRSTAMVTNRNLKPIFVQGIVRTTDDGSNIEGMGAGRIEVSVISNFSW